MIANEDFTKEKCITGLLRTRQKPCRFDVIKRQKENEKFSFCWYSACVSACTVCVKRKIGVFPLRANSKIPKIIPLLPCFRIENITDDVPRNWFPNVNLIVVYNTANFRILMLMYTVTCFTVIFNCSMFFSPSIEHTHTQIKAKPKPFQC